jgi:hypothetical protein
MRPGAATGKRTCCWNRLTFKDDKSRESRHGNANQ